MRATKGREHIFEANGELVTSMYRSKKAHLIKIRKSERQGITDSQFKEFKEMFL